MCSTNSEENKVSKLLRAAFILNIRYNGRYSMSLVSIGELTVELHVGVSGIYNIHSSVLSYQFYIIAYTLDNIFR